MPRLIEEVVKPGLARFEYVHYIIFGSRAAFAALSTECAADQDYFWEFHDAYFGGKASYYTRDGAIELADETGLNTAQFAQCIDDRQHARAIDNGQRTGLERGVRGTPTILVNGQRVGTRLQSIIDAVRLAAGPR